MTSLFHKNNVPSVASAVWACPCCGSPVPPRAQDRPGRPRDYCTDDCRRDYNAVIAGLRAVDRIQRRATPDAWRGMRGRIFNYLNRRPWNRKPPSDLM